MPYDRTDDHNQTTLQQLHLPGLTFCYDMMNKWQTPVYATMTKFVLRICPASSFLLSSAEGGPAHSESSWFEQAYVLPFFAFFFFCLASTAAVAGLALNSAAEETAGDDDRGEGVAS